MRWFTVGGTTVLSLAASATIFVKLFGSHYDVVAGLCALGASILSGLHTAFHCDAYQAECRRLIGSYKDLESGFEAVQKLKLSEDDAAAREKELEKRYEELAASCSALPPSRLRKRAENEASAAKGGPPTLNSTQAAGGTP
jgi:hypothetical protein